MQIPVEASQGEQAQIPDFIRKLYTMIKTEPQIISFSEDGTEVHIHEYNKFVQELLPRYFRHSKWRSFIRQMNMYSFRKVNRGMKTFIFVNGVFRDGNQANFGKIRRKNNTREEEAEAETHLEAEVKQLVSLECQNAGIPHSQCPPPLPSTMTLPSLTGPLSPPSLSYTNSLLTFLSTLLAQRKKTLTVCQQIKQSMEHITKERKNIENKTIMGTVKDSMQMIEEISGKFRERMEGFVDEREAEGQGEVNVMDFIVGGTQCGGQGRRPRNSSVNQLVSFSSTSSLNPIIPQPITTKPGSQQAPQRKQSGRVEQDSVPQPPIQGPSVAVPPNQVGHPNELGLTNYCSFSSVTFLVNFDRQ